MNDNNGRIVRGFLIRLVKEGIGWLAIATPPCTPSEGFLGRLFAAAAG
jgi:hypothetical protein